MDGLARAFEEDRGALPYRRDQTPTAETSCPPGPPPDHSQRELSVSRGQGLLALEMRWLMVDRAAWSPQRGDLGGGEPADQT